MTASFIYDAVRTPFGRAGGALADVRPDDLAATVMRATVERTGLDPARTRAMASSDGIVYCTPAATPGTRRTASECPWLSPRPQKV